MLNAQCNPECPFLVLFFRWNKLTLAYTETNGLPALRVEISDLYQKARPSDVVVLAPEEGIFLAMLALLKVDCFFHNSEYKVAQQNNKGWVKPQP